MVIDTCIFIEHLRAKDKTTTTLFNLPADEERFLSAVTLFKLQMGALNSEKENDVQAITGDLTILPFDKDVAHMAGQIYRQLKRNNNLIGIPDIFIAATCLIFNQPIVTSNKKHFKLVVDLKII